MKKLIIISVLLSTSRLLCMNSIIGGGLITCGIISGNKCYEELKKVTKKENCVSKSLNDACNDFVEAGDELIFSLINYRNNKKLPTNEQKSLRKVLINTIDFGKKYGPSIGWGSLTAFCLITGIKLTFNGLRE